MLTKKFGSVICLIKSKSYSQINSIFIKIKESSIKIMWQVAEGCYGRKEGSQINLVR